MADKRERRWSWLYRLRRPVAAHAPWTSRGHARSRACGISESRRRCGTYRSLLALFFGHRRCDRRPPSPRRRRQSLPALWAMGCPATPILLALIERRGLPTARQLLDAHQYLRLKGMTFDLVMVNTRPASYLQELNDAIMTTVMSSPEAGLVDRAGGVHVRRRDVITEEDWAIVRGVARVHVRCDGTRLDNVLDLPEGTSARWGARTSDEAPASRSRSPTRPDKGAPAPSERRSPWLRRSRQLSHPRARRRTAAGPWSNVTP